MKDEVRALMLDLSVADDEVIDAMRSKEDAERRLFAALLRQSAARKAVEDRLRHAPSAHEPPTCARCGPVAEKYPHTTDYEVGS